MNKNLLNLIRYLKKYTNGDKTAELNYLCHNSFDDEIFDCDTIEEFVYELKAEIDCFRNPEYCCHENLNNVIMLIGCLETYLYNFKK